MEFDLFSTGRVEIRAKDDGPSVVAGYAAVFYVPGDPTTEYKSRNGGQPFIERFERGAFDRVLKDGNPDGRDVIAVPDHRVLDSKEFLGRTAAGTLRLFVDNVGLGYEADIPETRAAADMVAQIRRGDVRGSSLGFLPYRPGGSRIENRSEGPPVRWISDVGYLRDVGPTGLEAYRATSVSLRSDIEEAEAGQAEIEARARVRRAQQRQFLIDSAALGR